MTFVVEDGTGLPDATSYASRGEGDTFLAGQPGGTPQVWTDASDSEKDAALEDGTAWLDGTYKQRWKGIAVNATQALDWGRYGVRNESGYLLPNTPLPADLKNAAILMAVESLEATAAGTSLWPTLDRGESSGLKRLKEKFDVFEREREWHGASSTLPVYTQVEALLGDLIHPQEAGRMELS